MLCNTLIVAQSVNGIPLKDIDVEYVQIVGTSQLMSNKVKIDIDFGQRNSVWDGKDTRILDANGKALILNSMIDALNFMVENGYAFEHAYAFSTGGANVYHFLLRKLTR